MAIFWTIVAVLLMAHLAKLVIHLTRRTQTKKITILILGVTIVHAVVAVFALGQAGLLSKTTVGQWLCFWC